MAAPLIHCRILRKAKKEQIGNRLRYGELYSLNYYTEVTEKDRAYYEVYTLPRTAEVPELRRAMERNRELEVRIVDAYTKD